MKKIVLLILFFTYCCSFGQSQSDTLVQAKKIYTFSNLKSFDNYSISFNFKNVKANYYSIFNYSTGLNDTYVSSNNTLIYSKSSLTILNTTRGMKIDSFNPSGTKNIGFALVGGIFNLFSKK
jgi:hypothetical protein